MAEQAPQDAIREESLPSRMFANEKGHDEQAPKFFDGMPQSHTTISGPGLTMIPYRLSHCSKPSYTYTLLNSILTRVREI